MAALHRTVEHGINFFDTADVYGDGRSERLLVQLYRDHDDDIYVATKARRRFDLHTAAGYICGNLTAFVERSLRNLDRGHRICSSSTVRPPRCITDSRYSASSTSWCRPAKYPTTG